MAMGIILDLFFGYISVSNEHICVKSGVQINIGQTFFTGAQNHTFGKILQWQWP